MGEFGDFFAALARHAPEDADALCEARSRLERQRITSLPRLAGLSDAQWQRIDVEIGVEALIRNTLEELLEEEKTKTGGQQEPVNETETTLLNRNVAKEVPSAASSAPSLTFEPPENLEELWENLLLETLPPDKRQTLQEQWEETESRDDKFMMLLEYHDAHM
eukprot:g14849.t1